MVSKLSKYEPGVQSSFGPDPPPSPAAPAQRSDERRGTQRPVRSLKAGHVGSLRGTERGRPGTRRKGWQVSHLPSAAFGFGGGAARIRPFLRPWGGEAAT